MVMPFFLSHTVHIHTHTHTQTLTPTYTQTHTHIHNLHSHTNTHTHLAPDGDGLSLEHSSTAAGAARLTFLGLDAGHIQRSSGVHVVRFHHRLIVVIQAVKKKKIVNVPICVCGAAL